MIIFCEHVLTFYCSLLKNNQSPSEKSIEKGLLGNICRCTGYRPILDAMKSFSQEKTFAIKDIEDLSDWVNVCPMVSGSAPASCKKIQRDGKIWFSPKTLASLFDFIDSLPEDRDFKLVAGNTARGIYEDITESDTIIDLTKVQELKMIVKRPLEIGAGVTVTDSINHFKMILENDEEGYHYLQVLMDNLVYVASPALKDVATWAGNIMIKHQNHEFESDMFTMLESLGVKIKVAQREDGNLKTSLLTPAQLLATNMKRKVIQSIIFPKLTNSHSFQYFKVSPRAAFSHSHVGAAFLAKVDTSGKKFQGKPSFVYCGIDKDFVHAEKAEDFCNGKNLTDPDNVKKLFSVIDDEAKAGHTSKQAGQEFRSGLGSALLYKFLLHIFGESGVVADDKKSGSEDLRQLRPVQRGEHHYDQDKSRYPVTKPIKKLESEVQCTGEAEYVDDIPRRHDEVHAAFVVSTQANCDIESVTPQEALELAGVIDFITHLDIPGDNCVKNNKNYPEKLFATNHVHYAGQAVGLIIAKTRNIAIQAAKMVKVRYTNVKKPVLSIKEALEANEPERISSERCGGPKLEGDVEAELSAGNDIVAGEFEIGSQYHFHLETQTCIVTPEEDGVQVISTTQYMDAVQKIVAGTLGIKESDVNIRVRRLGGGFGGKISQPNNVAAACAVAATKLRRPVRMLMDLRTNMEMLGKRLPYLVQYKASVDEDKKLTGVDMKLYCDSGYSFSESTADGAANYAKNVYVR